MVFDSPFLLHAAGWVDPEPPLAIDLEPLFHGVGEILLKVPRQQFWVFPGFAFARE